MTFLAICQKLKILWHFEIFINTGPYGAGNFKMLLLQFLSDVSQTLWGHILPWWNTLLLFLGIGKVLKNLWHFEILAWVSTGNLKCGISRKWLIIERNGRKFGTRGTTVHICKVLLMCDCLSLFWDHLVHFAKFPILRFLGLLVYVSRAHEIAICPSIHPSVSQLSLKLKHRFLSNFSCGLPWVIRSDFF